MEEIVYHIPALLEETISGLSILPQGTYVDVTFGGGGHSRAICQQLGDGGKLYSFDQDIDAYQNALNQHNAPFWVQAENNGKWQFVHSNFRYLKNFMDYYGHPAYDSEIPGSGVDGILADLGVSFHHFDEAERGFSFRFTGPLDMRMNQSGGKTASEIINTYDEEALARILFLYGELKNSRQIARQIVRHRSVEPILRTEQLVGILTGGKLTIRQSEIEVDTYVKKDLARIFQALRIEVNDEMKALEEMLLAGKEMLRPGGRFAILTYHSLEDRMVKNCFKTGNLEGLVKKDFYGNLICPFGGKNGKVIVATDEEIARNPRSRSAKLRIATKIESIQ